MKQVINIGQVDYTVLIFIPDPASTTGQGKTGLAHSAITAGYVRVETDNDVVDTAITMVDLASLTAAHSDGGWEQVDATLRPGLYRFDIPDGAFATGAWSVVVYVMVASGTAAASPMEFILSIAPGAAGGLVTIGTGTNQFKSNSSAEVSADVTKLLGTAWLAPGTAGTPDVNTKLIGGGSVPSGAVPNAVAGAAGGIQIAGSNAATTYATLTVTGATVLTGNVSLADGLTIPAPSTGSRPGIAVTGNGGGAGIIVTGGSSSGNGITLISGAGGALAALSIQGAGTARGIDILTAAGDGIRSAPTAGNGLVLTGNGTSMHGTLITGGTAGTSDGMKLVAGTGGVDLRAAITGNLTGTVSGTVAGVTPSTAAQVAAVLTTALADTYAANGVAPTLQQAIMAIHQGMFDFSISTTTIAVEKLGGTSAFDITLDDATTPTAAHRA